MEHGEGEEGNNDLNSHISDQAIFFAESICTSVLELLCILSRRIWGTDRDQTDGTDNNKGIEHSSNSSPDSASCVLLLNLLGKQNKIQNAAVGVSVGALTGGLTGGLTGAVPQPHRLRGLLEACKDGKRNEFLAEDSEKLLKEIWKMEGKAFPEKK